MGHPVSDEAENKEMDITSFPSSGRQTENAPYVYKVGYPPRKKFVTELTDTLKEALFPDDPLRQYRDQPRSRKFMLGLAYLFPIFKWGRGYNLVKFKADIIAGLTIACLCIPQVYTHLSIEKEWSDYHMSSNMSFGLSKRTSGIQNLLIWIHNMDSVSSPMLIAVKKL